MFRTLGMRAWFGKQLHVAGAVQVFDGQGKLVDDTVKKLSSQFMEGFAAFVASHTPPGARISELEHSPAQGRHH